MDYLGDYLNGSTVNLYFTTHNSAGAATAPLTAYEAGDVIVYKNSSNAQKTTTNGVTMTSPFDTIVGLHNVTFDTSNNTGDTNFWQAGNDYTVVLSADTETVDSQIVVRVLGQFSLENRCVNWAKVGSPTTTVGLSGTTVKEATDVQTTAAAIKSKTDNLPADPADASDIASAFSTVNSTLATIAGYIDTEVAAIKAKTDNLPANPAAVGSAMTLSSAYDFAKGTVAMTESYPTLGVIMTPAQALYSAHQMLAEKAISGTTLTTKKRDQSTTAKTFTLDSATAPTSIVEAS